MKLLRRTVFGLALLSPVLCAGASSGLYSQSSSLTEPTPGAFDQFSSNDHSGVSLSDDGKTALVADMLDSVGGQADAGKAYIYSYIDGAWKLAQELDDPDGVAGDNFGASIALSGDGKTALIGSRAAVNPSASGKAYLYVLNDGKWSQANEFDDPTPTANHNFGNGGLGLSDDGKTAVIGASAATVNGNTDAGEAYIYSDSSGSWKQVFAVLDPDAAANDFFGISATLSAGGDHALIGSRAAVGGQAVAGKAYLYTSSNGSWTQIHEFDDPQATNGDFFAALGVALSQDGTTAVFGAPSTTVGGTTFAGEGYIFKDNNGTWTMAAAIPDPDNASNDFFSTSVGVSLDGQRAVFGSRAAVNGQSFAGKAYVYALQNGSWSKLKEFDDPTMTGGDTFGEQSAALSGDGETLIAGTSAQSVNGISLAGEVYVYQSPADLALELNVDPRTLTEGQQATIQILAISEPGVVTANNATVTLTLPAGLSYASSDGVDGTCADSGSTVTCSKASLTPGTTWMPTVTVNATGTGTLQLKGTISSNQPDPVSSNNASSIDVTVTAAPSSGSGGGGTDGLLPLGLLGLLAGMRRKRRSQT